MGSTARSARHWLSAWKADSNCSHGSGWQPGTALPAAPSLYAPGAPWYATAGAMRGAAMAYESELNQWTYKNNHGFSQAG